MMKTYESDPFLEALYRQREELPRCTKPVGSRHDWEPATMARSVCTKCGKTLMLVDGDRLVVI